MVKGTGRLSKKEAKAGHCDFPLTVMVTILVIFGIVMIFSASYYYSINTYGTPFQYLKDQMFNACLGFFLMWIVSRIDYRVFRRFAFLTAIKRHGCLLHAEGAILAALTHSRICSSGTSLSR